MPNTVIDQQMADFEALAPGQSFANKERAWLVSLGGGIGSMNDLKMVAFAPFGPGSVADIELKKWVGLANGTYALGLPLNLSVTDYKMAVLNAGGPT